MSLRSRLVRCESYLTLDKWAAATALLSHGVLPSSERERSTAIDTARELALLWVPQYMPAGLGDDDREALLGKLAIEAHDADGRSDDICPNHAVVITDTASVIGLRVATLLGLAAPDEELAPALFPHGRFRGVTRMRTAAALEIGDLVSVAWDLLGRPETERGRPVVFVEDPPRISVLPETIPRAEPIQ